MEKDLRKSKKGVGVGVLGRKGVGDGVGYWKISGFQSLSNKSSKHNFN